MPKAGRWEGKEFVHLWSRRALQDQARLRKRSPKRTAATAGAAPGGQRRQVQALATQGQAAAGPAPTSPSPPNGSAGRKRVLLRAAGQVALLAVALAGLILLPAQLSGRLAPEPARTAAAYCF